jgi:8-oxo-dGTP diphosphatase
MRTIEVTAAVIEQNGRFLVTKRQDGVHLAGYWEFPGGKCDTAETLAACVARELREELNVAAIVEEKLLSTTYVYDDRLVNLHFFRCQISERPSPMQGQLMRWVPREQLRRLQFPPADEELIQLLCERTTDR